MSSKNININELAGQDFINLLTSLPFQKGSKDGRDYYYLDLVFVNGYTKRIFLNSDALFGIKDALAYND